jgi:tetratricopeptide (TPR) repeat protein
MKTKSFFIVFVVISSLFHSYCFAENLATIFCGDSSMDFSFEKVILTNNTSEQCWIIDCDCDCTGDNNTLNLISWKINRDPILLLSIDNIKSYRIIDKFTNKFKEIVAYTRDELPEGGYNEGYNDTLIFDGRHYICKGVTHNISLSPFDTAAYLIKIKKNLFPRQNEAWRSIKENYIQSISLFKSGKKLEAAQLLLKSVGSKPWTIDNSNVAIFNDLGYFLTEAAQYKDAVDVLGEVIAKFPDRAVAYLNIADAYSGLNNIIAAKENYQKYIVMMTNDGKQAKIPKRVTDFMKK